MQARIIPRQEHGISRKQLSPNALRTLYRLNDHGFIAYLIGGCVRDLLLERTPKDFDIATNATPGQLKRLFRNCRLVGRRFRLAHLHFQDEILEVSTFRAAAPADDTESEETDRHPRHLKDEDGMVLRDNVFGTPEDDALRRDFTINALAYNIADFTVIDYAKGQNDLQERLIRPIGDPVVRFTEDPVRMLRAVRFAATLNFKIEPETWGVTCELSATISRAAPARLYEEILKLFLLGSAQRVFFLLDESGLLASLFPSFSQWFYVSSTHRELLHRILEWLDEISRTGSAPSPPLLLAALFGRCIEERSLALHREGMPRQQALDATCAAFMESLSKTVRIPARVVNQLRGILALQPSLHRPPPRRPLVMANRTDFPDAIAYLRLTSEISGENLKSLNWWDSFLEKVPSMPPEETTSEAVPARKRKRRRRRQSHAPLTTD